MDTDARDVEDIFDTARKIQDGRQRHAYLDEACAGDGDLRESVEELLTYDATSGSLLDSPPADVKALPLDGPIEGPGSLIGHYRLLEVIGEGGFGNVYLAEQQEPVRRPVALKIIKLGMDTRQVIGRFEAERQALALMDHLNIAKALDAGATETGRPYFVMDVVRGSPITEYCDQRNLTIEERLRLFVDVCHAIQHAHQKGIIHRDIKPSNVLVTHGDDGEPIPKVIDFGIAKATRQRLTEKTLFTEHRQLIGTPEYMSPEQAEFTDHDVDTRSDIYSLGVLLYELLVGTTPFDDKDLRDHGYDEICRVIREGNPATPSRRLNKLVEEMTEVSQHRQSQPAVLKRLLRGDLDWIVMKCLETDRTRRYETANALARDIERFLENDPVEARPPTAAYRIHKFVQRNRIAVYAGLVVFLLLVVGIVSTTIGFVSARYQANRAEQLSRQEQAAKQKAERQRDLADRHRYLAQMRLAQDDWDRGQIGRLHDVLDNQIPQPGRPDLRGWEWYYFLSLCHSELLTLYGHANGVCAVSWSPDGRSLASACAETLKVWDAATGDEILSLPRGLSGEAARAPPLKTDGLWSADAKGVAVPGPDGTVKIWDASSGEELHTLRGHTEYVGSVSWSRDGRSLASASTDGTVIVWDSASGKRLHTLTHPGPVSSVSWRPDGQRIATAGAHGVGVRLWDAASGAEVLSLRKDETFCVAWSPDGQRMVASSFFRAWIWDVATGEEVLQLRGHNGPVDQMHWSRDGLRIALASRDETIGIWDTTTGRRLRTLRGHTGWVTSVVWSPDDRRLASASEDGSVKIWDVGNQPETPVLREDPGSVDAPVRSPDGSRTATREANLVKIHDADTGGETLSLLEHLEEVCGVAWSPNSRHLASAAWDGTVRIWDAVTGEELRILRGHVPFKWIGSVVWSPDGRQLASAGWDQRIRIWDADTGRELRTLRGHTAPISALAWSPDGHRLASIGWDSIKVWDPLEGNELVTLEQGRDETRRAARSFQWSPDNRMLSWTPRDNGETQVWDATPGYEFAASAEYQQALARKQERKRRDEKPSESKQEAD